MLIPPGTQCSHVTPHTHMHTNFSCTYIHIIHTHTHTRPVSQKSRYSYTYFFYSYTRALQSLGQKIQKAVYIIYYLTDGSNSRITRKSEMIILFSSFFVVVAVVHVTASPIPNLTVPHTVTQRFLSAPLTVPHVSEYICIHCRETRIYHLYT